MATLPVFPFVTVHAGPLTDGIAQEAAWLAQAASRSRPLAHVWNGPPGFIVPRSYERRPAWQHACERSAAAGWPVQVRHSGGGLVPQGPGVLNLSLAWRGDPARGEGIDGTYRAFTDQLALALARLDIEARAQAVEGSFCDGRYNLAIGGRKCLGTAQAWRRIEGVPVVLAHAVVIASADEHELTAAANQFEAACGGDLRYRAGALVSLATAWREAHGGRAPPPGFDARVAEALARQFAQVVAPQVTEFSRDPDSNA